MYDEIVMSIIDKAPFNSSDAGVLRHSGHGRNALFGLWAKGGAEMFTPTAN